MAYYHPELQLAYLSTPRTASRATSQALQDVGFIKEGGHHSGVPDRAVESVATTIRDPLDICLSWVMRNKKPSCTPEEIARQEIETNNWIEKGKVASRFLDVADTVFRYEDDLEKQVTDWINEHSCNTVAQIDIPVVGRRSDRSYTEEQRRICEEFCQQERIELGYK